MSRSAQFAELLTKAVRAIAAQEHKHIEVVQDDLGYTLARKGGTAIEFWRKGNVPAKIADVEALACELVKRRRLQTVDELEQFLVSAGHPHPQLLLAQLAPLLDHKQNVETRSTPSSRKLSPFTVGPPITVPRQFFGREDELTDIFGLWRHFPLQNVAIIGLRRSGKTSLLHYLKNITRTPAEELRSGQRSDWLPQPERYRWVSVDFQDVRLSQRERLLRYLLTGLKLPVLEPCELHSFMDVVGEHLRTPSIILMDEMSDGLASLELGRRFWNSLRSLG
jgi:hypothetical protein